MTDTPATPVDRLENYQSMSDDDILTALVHVKNYMDTIVSRPKLDMKKFQEILKNSMFFEGASSAVRVYAIMTFWNLGLIPFHNPFGPYSKWNKQDYATLDDDEYKWFMRFSESCKDDMWRLALLATNSITKMDSIYSAVDKYARDKDTLIDRVGDDKLHIVQNDTNITPITSDEVLRRMLCLRPWQISNHPSFLERQDDDTVVVMGCVNDPEGMMNKKAIPKKFINPKIVKVLMRHNSNSYGGRRVNSAMKKWLLTLDDETITSLIEDAATVDDLFIINNMLGKAYGDTYLTAIASKINTLM